MMLTPGMIYSTEDNHININSSKIEMDVRNSDSINERGFDIESYMNDSIEDIRRDVNSLTLKILLDKCDAENEYFNGVEYNGIGTTWDSHEDVAILETQSHKHDRDFISKYINKIECNVVALLKTILDIPIVRKFYWSWVRKLVNEYGYFFQALSKIVIVIWII